MVMSTIPKFGYNGALIGPGPTMQTNTYTYRVFHMSYSRPTNPKGFFT